MPSIDFETPEDVDLRFSLAGTGSRFAAALIDYLMISLLICLAWTVVIAGNLVALDWDELFDPVAYERLAASSVLLLVALLGFLHSAYFILQEWLWDGRTLGKKAMGLRVVKEGGYPIGFGPAFLRTLGRTVDMLPTLYVIGAISTLLSSRHQRIGDFMASTVVIREDAPPAQTVVAPAPSDSLGIVFTKTHLATLDEKVLDLLDEAFHRASTMDPQTKMTVFRQLADRLQRRMQLQVDLDAPQRAEEFLLSIYHALREVHQEIR